MGPERSARLTVLRPEYRRFIAAVLARLRAPRPLARSIAADLRAKLERAERQGATPALAIAALGDPDMVAGQVRANRPFQPVPDRRPAFLASACALAFLATIASAVHITGRARDLRRPTATLIREIAPRGVWAGASVMAATDLQGNGLPMLVGANNESGSLWAVVWAITADGSVQPVGEIPLARGSSEATRVLAGRFLPGAGQQAVIFVPDGEGATAYLIGWRNGRPLMLGATPLPGVSVGSASAGPLGQGGPDSLFMLGPDDALQRWGWDPAVAQFTRVIAVRLDPAPAAGVQDLAVGQVHGRPYVAAFQDVGTPYACSGGPPGVVTVLQAGDLHPVWRGELGARPIQSLGAEAPDGALLALADASPGDAGGQIERWTGTGWTDAGVLACGLRIIGPAPTASPATEGPGSSNPAAASWLATNGRGQVDLLAASGAVVGEAPWPFLGDAAFLYYGRWPYAAVGSVVVFADFWRLETARWTGATWARVWQAADAATLQVTGILPLSGGWGLTDDAGNVYGPSGATWTWSGTATPTSLVASWLPLAHGAYRLRVSGAGSVRRLELVTPQGRIGYSGSLPGGVTGVQAAVPLPLGTNRVDLGVLLDSAEVPGAASLSLLVFRPMASGGLRQVARLGLPLPLADVTVGAPYVLPGSGRAEMVVPVTSAGSEPGMRQPVAALWNGHALRRVAASAPPGAVQGFGGLTLGADGRWVAVGLAQGTAAVSDQGGPAGAYFQRTPPAGTDLLLGRLGPGDAPTWTHVPWPAPPVGGPVRALSLPDGSGRVLLSVSGRTFIYRVM